MKLNWSNQILNDLVNPTKLGSNLGSSILKEKKREKKQYYFNQNG